MRTLLALAAAALLILSLQGAVMAQQNNKLHGSVEAGSPATETFVANAGETSVTLGFTFHGDDSDRDIVVTGNGTGGGTGTDNIHIPGSATGEWQHTVDVLGGETYTLTITVASGKQTYQIAVYHSA